MGVTSSSVEEVSKPPSNQQSTTKSANNKKEKWMSWDNNYHTKIMENLQLPINETTGDIVLPPRLPLLEEFEYGVLFAGTGSIDYAQKEIIPAILHMRDRLGIPNAIERRMHRQEQHERRMIVEEELQRRAFINDTDVSDGSNNELDKYR